MSIFLNFLKRNEQIIVKSTLTIGIMILGVWQYKKKCKIQTEEQKKREENKYDLKQQYAKKQEEDRRKVYEQNPEYAEKLAYLKIKQEVFKYYHLDDETTPDGESLVNERTLNATGVQPLVGNMIGQGEICVLVGTTGNGKSLLATGIAIEVSQGIASSICKTSITHQAPQTVLYFDSELSDNDRKDRYSGLAGSNMDNLIYYRDQQFETVYQLLHKLHKAVCRHGFNKNMMIVLDNIIALVTKTMSAKEVGHLFKALKYLQSLFYQNSAALTIIIVNHTVGNAKKALDSDDIAGSINFSRFAKRTLFIKDTDDENIKQFYVDKHTSKGKDTHYIKIVEKPYVHFEEISYTEGATLSDKEAKSPSKKGKGNPGLPDEIVQKMRELKAQGYDIPGICKEVNKSYPTVKRYWEKFESEECDI